MLVSYPFSSTANNTTAATATTTTSTTMSQRCYTGNSGWPLDETEEDLMTLATSFTRSASNHSPFVIKKSRSGVRCDACQRRFHSVGNLANHQQLYQH